MSEESNPIGALAEEIGHGEIRGALASIEEMVREHQLSAEDADTWRRWIGAHQAFVDAAGETRH